MQNYAMDKPLAFGTDPKETHCSCSFVTSKEPDGVISDGKHSNSAASIASKKCIEKMLE
jgi:hypothetical protein